MTTNFNILINRQAAGGDVLMTTPIVRKLFQDYRGNCNIDYYVNPECKSYIETNPYIRQVYYGLPGEQAKAEYDRVIDLDLVYERSPEMHAIDAYAMAAIGHCDFDRGVDLFTDDEEKNLATEFKKTIGNEYIVLHMRRFAWPSRNMPESFWAKVVQGILENTNLTIMQVGSLNEPAFIGDPRLIDARGFYTIPELKEAIEHSFMYIGSDSGPAHVASATSTDMMVLYTSVKEQYRRPLRQHGKFIPIAADIECYGCHAKNPAPCTTFICSRGDVECVNRFDPQELVDQVVATYKERTK
jgi:heptosyltransferase III